MTDPIGDLPGPSAGRGGDGTATPPGMPRWVKVSLLVVGALILVFLILKVAGVGGRHGPGMHQGAVPQAVPAHAEPG